MDTSTRATLARVHSTLFNDLTEIGLLARGQGADVENAIMRVLDHLRDLWQSSAAS